MGIQPFRIIQPEIFIDKDGVLTDIKAYVSNFSIDYGDVSGAGTQANDGCPATATITIKNDDINNFNPLDQNSPWNKVGGTGGYAPFLWENKNILIKANAVTPVYATERITGNGSNIYTSVGQNIIPFSVTIKRVIGTAPTMASLGSYAFTDNYLGKPLGSYTFDELYGTGNIITGCGVNYINGQFNFGKGIPSGTILEVQYMTAAYTSNVLFEGVLGDDISPSEYQVSLTTRDKTKILMDKIIDFNDIRQYVASGTSESPIYTDTKTSMAYNDGVPIEIYIQNLLDDTLGSGIMTLYANSSPVYGVTPNNDILQYQTVWSVISGLVTSIGWYIGFRYSPIVQQYVLTLLEPPRTKTTADFALTHTDDIYTAQGKLDFSSIRNYIMVKYIDIDGKEQHVDPFDPTSISKYGERLFVLESENTKGITKSADAVKLGQNILADLKDARIYTQIEMPFFPAIKPFSTISLSYPKLSSTVDFYAVESVRHEFDFEGNRYRTFLNCNKSVTGGYARWKRIAARPGAYQPITSNKLTEAYNYAPPTSLTVTGTAIVFSETAVNVTASVSFIKPILDNPSSYELQYKKNTDATWDNATKIITKDTDFRIILTDTVQYNFRVASIAKNGDRGPWSSVLNSTPSSSNLYVTDADLSGERDNTIYIKTQAQFDLWLNDVCNTTAFSPDYSRVVICEGEYTAGNTFNRKLPINVNKNIFTIEGRGDVKIVYYALDENYGDIIKTNADAFTLRNINLSINKYWGGTPVIMSRAVVLSVGDSPNTLNNYIIEGVVVSNDNPIVTNVRYILIDIENSNFTDATLIIQKCNIWIDIMILSGNKAKNIIIKDNIINNSFIDCTNSIIKNNIFLLNGQTAISSIDCKIEGNTFIYQNAQRPDYVIFNYIPSDLIAANNSVVFEVSCDIEENPQFVGSTYPQVGNVVVNNVCIDKEITWLRKYNTTTITPGSDYVTITGATFLTDLKIGQKIKVQGVEKTIINILSDTVLQVNSVWLVYATGISVYFQFAGIQEWMRININDRNNIVTNNTNNSY